METEIELKLFVSSDSLHLIQEKITSLKIVEMKEQDLRNIYYDTPDLLLRKNDMGLRVRQNKEGFVQTLKTAGRVIAGLHQRPEYNVPCENTIPNIALIPREAWPYGLDLEALQKQLFPLFSTDFNRQYGMVSMQDGTQIELAFDTGEVRSSETAREPICEIELELKSGKIDALFLLARELAKGGGLRLGNISKAATGYRLAANDEGDPIKELGLVPLNLRMSIEEAFVQSLEYALSHWLYHEHIYVERKEQDALLELSHAVALVRHALMLYGSLIPRRASTLLRQELQWLEAELSWIREAKVIARLCEEKAYFLRKLNAQKQLFLKLDKRYQSLPTTDKMNELLHSERYCNLLLDLNRWVLTRGWQPYLDDRAKEKLLRPVKYFANKLLSHSWDAILSTFSFEHKMDRFAYLNQEPRLFRYLLTTACFAYIFDEEKSALFRLSWFDCFQGMDDLFLLDSVRIRVDDHDISEENKQQIEKWLYRKEESLIHAMQRSREIGLSLSPYWD